MLGCSDAGATFAASVDGDPRALLRNAQSPAALLSEWLPGEWVAGPPTTLDSGVYPQDAVTALRVPGMDIVGADAVLGWVDRVPPHVAASVGNRRLVILQMHSVNDSLGYIVWQAGRRLRALGMDPDAGVFLDEGEPTPPEEPFWAGRHPVGDGYPLPFHPLDLGEELLRAELGFVLEGRPAPDDVEPFDIAMYTFSPGEAVASGRRFFRKRTR